MMPRIISFRDTSPALLAGAKTVTRRQWKPSWAAKFKRGDLIFAYDKSPRAGGKQIATLRLTADPTYEPNAVMPDSDYKAEGFEWMARHADQEIGFGDWRLWKRDDGGASWVIRFEVVA